jgi:hypothetical protein
MTPTMVPEITGITAHPAATAATLRRLRPLVGSLVTLHTAWGTFRGTLLSCVKDSAWLVADDDSDHVVPLSAIFAVQP